MERRVYARQTMHERENICSCKQRVEQKRERMAVRIVVGDGGGARGRVREPQAGNIAGGAVKIF